MTPAVAQIMLDELRDNRLEVVVQQSSHSGHYVWYRELWADLDRETWRSVVSRNIPWYQELCVGFEANRTKSRRRKLPDTRIKRKNIERILGRLSKGLPSTSMYVEELERLAYKYGIEK